jgi:cytochrome c553
MRILVPLVIGVCAGTASAAPGLKLGQRLYQEGTNARSEPIRALTGMPPAPLTGTKAACAACHGADARGSAAAPDIRWSVLARAGAQPPYSERLFARAVSEGFSPSGSTLMAGMPRYSLSTREVDALAAYLKSLR